MVIIITGTFDSVDVFSSQGTGGKWINLAIGVIVSIIGVRFMPSDIWGSLTAPSSALAATIVVGIPFMAFVFITVKIKNIPARKVLWLFYLIFMSYLVLQRLGNWENGFAGVYITFLALATIMLFFDGTVREFFYREKAKNETAKARAGINLIGKGKLIKRIAELQEIISDINQPKVLRDAAKKELEEYTATYGDLAAY
jgi:prepilin signal peptidase PulO-like enzyme (type II secretory pathway)